MLTAIGRFALHDSCVNNPHVSIFDKCIKKETLRSSPIFCPEPLVIIRNQQVVGSSPIVGSSKCKT